MSILENVKAELLKAQKESVKAKVKALLTKHADARAIVDGIEDEIVIALTSVGESEADIRRLLSDSEEG